MKIVLNKKEKEFLKALERYFNSKEGQEHFELQIEKATKRILAELGR